MDKATEFKNLGNEAFRNKEFEKAVDLFTQAISHNPNDHVLYSNRSGAYCSLEKFDEALDDANKCIQLNSSFFKGYSRKGAAQEGMGFLDQALETYEAGLKIDPTSDLLLERKAEVENIINGDAGGGFP